MSIILHMGVFNKPYVESSLSTGDVAEILEEKYQIMEGFYELNANVIADNIARSLNNALESVLKLGVNPLTIKPFDKVMNNTESLFKKFLDNEDLKKLGRKGVPTHAALKGYSSRFKKGKSGRRPSFIDTGLYQANFKAWVEVKDA